MPLHKIIHHNEATTLFIWKIDENFEELISSVSLTPNSKKRIESMKSTSHQNGFLAVRKLLEYAGYTDFDLYYSKSGKPNLKDGLEISISHSFDFSVIAISNTLIGVDIEMNRPKIKKIASKFIADENSYLNDENLIEKLTVIWGAKESLFKIYPDGGLLFKKHLPIETFDLSDQSTTGYIRKDGSNEKYGIYFELFDGYTLVYATKSTLL